MRVSDAIQHQQQDRLRGRLNQGQQAGLVQHLTAAPRAPGGTVSGKAGHGPLVAPAGQLIQLPPGQAHHGHPLVARQLEQALDTPVLAAGLQGQLHDRTRASPQQAVNGVNAVYALCHGLVLPAPPARPAGGTRLGCRFALGFLCGLAGRRLACARRFTAALAW